MNFVSIQFLVFFLVVFALFWESRDFLPARRFLLLGANLFFYAFAGVYYVPLLLAVAAIAWATGVGLAQNDSARKRRLILWAAVFCNLFLLAFFKYYEFFFLSFESLCVLFGGTVEIPLALAEIAFPIGISFYTFQAIAYCVEQYKNPALKPESYGRILVYLSFFPTVLAGPIMRPAQFFPQYDAVTGNVPSPEDAPLPGGDSGSVMDRAFAHIVSGLFKKVVLASYLSETVVRDIFQTPESYSSWSVLVGVYSYAVQIYCDFSGYTDLALGVALLLGFRLPANFAAPYLACDLQDFWRRWHISLSSWLRDYLYIPLGGSKRGNRYVNLLLTMLLGGLWHGAHTRFLIWGALHGGGLAVVHGVKQFFASRRSRNGADALFADRMYGRLPQPFWRVVSWGCTFHFVCFAWIFFRAEDMERATEIIRRLVVFGQPGDGVALLALPAIVAGIAIQGVGPWLYRNSVAALSRCPVVVKAALLALVVNCIFRMGPEGVLPFIYFQF